MRVSAVPASVPYIQVMGETTATQLCRIETEASLSYEEVLLRTCSILDSEGIIPDAMSHMHAYRLCDADGVSLESQMFMRPGETVHLHSCKGEEDTDRRQARRKADVGEEISTNCFVMYGEDIILELPARYIGVSALAIRDWACEMLGLVALKHYAFRNDDGHYVLQEHAVGRPVSPMRSTEPAALPVSDYVASLKPTPMLLSDDVWSVPPAGGPYVRVRRTEADETIVWPIQCGPMGISDQQLRQHLSDQLCIDASTFVLNMEHFPMTKPWWSPGDLAVFVEKK